MRDPVIRGGRLRPASAARLRRPMSDRMYKALYAYAWDLADEGLEVALGRIRPTGINTLTLARATTPASSSARTGFGQGLFPEGRHGLFRGPARALRPDQAAVNPLVADIDAFALLEQKAPDLERVAWVVCCHNTPLGEQYPDFISRNSFGDPYLQPLPCACGGPRLCRQPLRRSRRRHDLAGLVLETPGWLP